MSNAVRSLINSGNEGVVIEIECHLSNSLPNIVIVGFANKAVDESKERIRGAFSSSTIQLPRKRITINLAPADIPKDSSSLDLAIATSILNAGKQVKNTVGSNQAIIGELGLNGMVRPVRGIIGKLLAGRNKNISTFFIPSGNLEQALLVPNITLLPVETFKDMYLHLNEIKKITPIETNTRLNGSKISDPTPQFEYEISDITGQVQAKRSLEIAAAGGHNLLLNGPPGTGKSMLAKALPSILPPLNIEEMLEVTHVNSLINNDYDKVIATRPFRAPHHSASHVAIVGGGATLHPGEISLSHRGVLFFDELPEFNRSTLEALRQPLEDRTITVSRAKQTTEYPANFLLIGTANPCPCGYYGMNKSCSCQPHQIMRYQRKLSGPLIDRIDLHVQVHEVEHDKLLSQQRSSKIDSDIRNRVLSARKLQAQRYNSPSKLNSDMTNRDIKSLAHLTAEARSILDTAAKQLDISARSYMRAIKVARTIADLSNSKNIEPAHLTEALQFRSRQLTV